jgi:hypothetical protein
MMATATRVANGSDGDKEGDCDGNKVAGSKSKRARARAARAMAVALKRRGQD